MKTSQAPIATSAQQTTHFTFTTDYYTSATLKKKNCTYWLQFSMCVMGYHCQHTSECHILCQVCTNSQCKVCFVTNEQSLVNNYEKTQTNFLVSSSIPLAKRLTTCILSYKWAGLRAGLLACIVTTLLHHVEAWTVTMAWDVGVVGDFLERAWRQVSVAASFLHSKVMTYNFVLIFKDFLERQNTHMTYYLASAQVMQLLMRYICLSCGEV